MADKVHGFKGIQFQAIIGLGYSSLAQNNTKPMFDNIMEQ
jgi:hypothetical protein